MITEDYVSFETAKLLKEKGFDEKCRALYTFWFDEVEGPKEDEAENWNIEPKYFSAPTLQMAMKWLREVYDLHIIAYPWRANKKERIHWCCHVYKSFNLFGRKYTNETLKSYEEACEVAIKYCLEKLI